MNEGHHTEQYNKLAAYRKELLRSNPGFYSRDQNNDGWQILTAVGVDANNGMYPIAFAIAESIGTVFGTYTTISRPNMRGERLKQTLWNVARSSTIVWFNTHMEEMKILSEDAWKWFEDKNIAQ
ncbi:hypothetical protein M0R45_036426 [Rubus argutus]|uniref:Uncharacterized protein n=1 Tax=Rubus argutus TaxID=59490 RepID=A0AAW1W1I2_RUBAR